mgnify:CR=1 FL=1
MVWVRFPLSAQIYHGVIAMVASKTHNLEVGGSSPPPVTKLLYMEEIEKAKMTRTKKTNSSEVHQIMTALTDTTIRGIVRSVNEEGIKREDIVSLLKENGQFVLIYFR